ncbi:NUDIX domain-containing protein [Candidatus Pacebacteria bacterium]|nr:NUDIX domain-containing protein [Candidatus Paceibacterota bacterium]
MKLQVGAKGIIARSDRKVLILRESGDAYDEGTEEGRWDVVGGRIDVGEKLIEGLRREIKEESGLHIDVVNVIGATETFPIIKDVQHQIVRVYYACRTDSDSVMLSPDHDKYDWIDPNEHAKFNIMDDLHEIFNNYNKLV